jgi:hypothetical protein
MQPIYYKEQVEADQNIAVKFMTFDGKLLGAPLTVANARRRKPSLYPQRLAGQGEYDAAQND